MLVIQQRKSSICLTVLLTLLLVFTSADVSTSNQRICEMGNTRNISYFKVDSGEVNWNDAWRLCNNSSFTLPVICDQQEQDALTNYLKANTGSSAAWTSGRMIKFNEWKWVDGQPFNGVIKVEHESYTHVAINVNRSYKAQSPISKTYYLCQYSGSSCNSDDIRVTNGCVRPSDDDRTWYDARNHCLRNGGDLAILKDADLGIQGNLSTRRINDKVISINGYWIGLRNSTWRWIWQETVPSGGSGEEVQYSNWSNDPHSTIYECISINASNGEWKSVRCTNKKKVVCERSHTSSSTTSSTKTSTMSTMSSKQAPSLSESTTKTMTEGHSNGLLTAVVATVAVGLCVIVASNIIVALVVRKYYLRRANTSSRSEATETKHYQDLEMTRRQANPDGTYTELQLQPDYEEVSQGGN